MTAEFTVQIQPPHFDKYYCRVSVRATTRGFHGSAESRAHAIERVRTHLPDDCGPADITVQLHDDFADAFSPREFVGDQTLTRFASDGDAAASTAEQDPWYKRQPAFDDWVAPLLNAPGERALYLRGPSTLHGEPVRSVATWVVAGDSGVLYHYSQRGTTGLNPLPVSCWYPVQRTKLVHHLADGDSVHEYLRAQPPVAELVAADASPWGCHDDATRERRYGVEAHVSFTPAHHCIECGAARRLDSRSPPVCTDCTATRRDT